MLDSGKIASVLGLLETMSGRQVAKRLRISRGVVQSIANGTYPSIGEGKGGPGVLGVHRCVAGHRIVTERCLTCLLQGLRRRIRHDAGGAGEAVVKLDLHGDNLRRYHVLKRQKDRELFATSQLRSVPGPVAGLRICQAEWSSRDSRQLQQLLQAVVSRRPCPIATALWLMGGHLRFASVEA